MKTAFDIAIVGAGPAGAAAATLLARAGWSVALIERQPFPRRKVCGECVAASNLGLLDALGVGAEFDALAGAELRRVALMRGRRTVFAPLPRGQDGRHAWGRALGREHLDTLLVGGAEAAGATVLQPWSLQSIAGHAPTFRLQVRPSAGEGGSVELEAAVVIAAHGSWEPLPAERAQRREARRASDLFAFKANFTGAAIDADVLPVLCFAGGYGGMVIADGGVATLACCVRADRLQALRRAQPGASAGEAIETMLRRECDGVGLALAGATRLGPWLASGPLRPGIRSGLADGVFRIGNAAGEAHPIVGEGMSMALQSAFVLAASIGPRRLQLTSGTGAAAAQRAAIVTFEALWRRRFARRLRVAAAFAHIAMRPALAGVAWPLLRLWPGALTHGARFSGKTRCAPEAACLRAIAP